MKKYKVKNGPFLKDKNTVFKMMKHLLFALIPIILFSFYQNGIIPFINNEVDVVGLFYPLIFILISAFTSFFIEFIYYKIKNEDNIKELLFISIFPGLFLGLILPINIPIPYVIFGSICATIIGKLLFGGFGKNIFNPVLVGVLFTIYALIITKNEISFININTNILLCLFAFFYLTFTKVIKWIIPICYILTVFIMTLIISYNNSLEYSLFQILSGSLLFSSIFLAPDPVTSPTTKYGQVLYGIGLGLLTVVFKYFTSYPEGILPSILIMNMLVFSIDKIGAKARFNLKKYIFIPILLIVFSILISFYIGISYKL